MSGDQVDLDAIERRRATVNVWSGDELFTIEMIVDEDVPALVAEVRRLRAEVRDLRLQLADDDNDWADPSDYLIPGAPTPPIVGA